MYRYQLTPFGPISVLKWGTGCVNDFSVMMLWKCLDTLKVSDTFRVCPHFRKRSALSECGHTLEMSDSLKMFRTFKSAERLQTVAAF